MKTVSLEIITPEKRFYQGEITSLVVDTPAGQLNFLPGHIPLVTVLSIGAIRIKPKDSQEWKEAFVSEGFLEVTQTSIRVFTQAAEWPEDIDVARASADEQRISDRLLHQKGLREYTWSKAALARAQMRLRVSKNIPR